MNEQSRYEKSRTAETFMNIGKLEELLPGIGAGKGELLTEAMTHLQLMKEKNPEETPQIYMMGVDAQSFDVFAEIQVILSVLEYSELMIKEGENASFKSRLKALIPTKSIKKILCLSKENKIQELINKLVKILSSNKISHVPIKLLLDIILQNKIDFIKGDVRIRANVLKIPINEKLNTVIGSKILHELGDQDEQSKALKNANDILEIGGKIFLHVDCFGNQSNNEFDEAIKNCHTPQDFLKLDFQQIENIDERSVAFQRAWVKFKDLIGNNQYEFKNRYFTSKEQVTQMLKNSGFTNVTAIHDVNENEYRSYKLNPVKFAEVEENEKPIESEEFKSFNQFTKNNLIDTELGKYLNAKQEKISNIDTVIFDVRYALMIAEKL
jgi:hypothetical protein